MNIGGFSVTRRLFLVFQYVLTIGMIIISLFFVKQLNFMLHADLGYNTKDIIMVKFMRSETGEEYINDMDAWKKKKMREMQMVQEIDQRLNSCPYISHWSKIESPNEAGVSFIRFKSQAEDYREVILLDANEAWMKMFDIQLVEGRLWNDSIDVDCRDYQVIVSESALKEFGITDYTQGELQPDRRLWYNTDKEDEMKTNPPYRIVGVVKDFHTSHLSKKSLPILITYGSGFRDSYTYASIIPDRKKEAIAYLHKLHDDTVGGEFSYTFVEDEVEAMYREDKRVAVIYSIFTTIAIFISILGLFSMSLFDVQQRYKEIAIRKVNGATAFEIVRLLLKRYFILLVISFVIAAPLAWLAIDRYLEDFANKTPVSWWLFVVAFLVTAIISLFTLIYQTQKAAGMNPANATKSE